MKPQHIDYIVTAAVFMALSISIARAETRDGVLRAQGLSTRGTTDPKPAVTTRASLPPSGNQWRSGTLDHAEGA